MTGYDVVTSDDRKIGRVVEDRDDHLIVEHGVVRKTRHALPKVFAHAVDAERVVRVTVGKDVIAQSPRLDDGDFDAQAVARHYGLAAGWERPDTQGAGEVLADDPAEGSVVEGQRHGVVPPEQQRAEIREGRHGDEPPHVRERSATAVDPFGQTANHG